MHIASLPININNGKVEEPLYLKIDKQLTRIIHDNAVNKDDNFFKYIDFQRAM